jgi:HK97 family phage major capsid protein
MEIKQFNKQIIDKLTHQKIYQAMVLDEKPKEDRTVSMCFSTETPILHNLDSLGTVYVVLGHKENEADLSLLNTGVYPLLNQHDPNQQIGVIRGAVIHDNKGVAAGQFSKVGQGNDLFTDVSDGIRNQISVGTGIKQLKRDGEIDGVPVFRATKWQPFEISLVSLAADQNGRIYRSVDLPSISESTNNLKLQTITTEKTKMEEQKMDVQVIREEANKEAQARISGIMQIKRQFAPQYDFVADAADDFIARGKTVADFKDYVLEAISKHQPTIQTAQSAEIGMSKKEVQKYSIVRGINAMLTGDWRNAGLEQEASWTATRFYGKTPSKNSIMLPYDILVRDVDFTTEGADLVATNFLGGSFIDLLQSKLVTRSLGATYIEGLKGPIDIPRISGGNTFYMFATENAGVTESTPTFDRVQLTPHTGAAWCEVSEQLLKQSSGLAERIIMQNLSDVIARGIDTQAINGLGVSGETDSVIYSAGNNVATSTGSLDYTDLIQFETLCAADNFVESKVAYLTTPTVRGYLRGKFTNATYGEIPLWMQGSQPGEGMILGYRAVASSICPSGTMLFGNWGDLIIALFGGVELKVNPYAKMTTRLTQLCAFVDFDCNLAHDNSFAKATGITS